MDIGALGEALKAAKLKKTQTAATTNSTPAPAAAKSTPPAAGNSIGDAIKAARLAKMGGGAAASAPAPTPAPAAYVPPVMAAKAAPVGDKFEKYRVMQKSNTPNGQIRQKMIADKCNKGEIDDFFATPPPPESAPPAPVVVEPPKPVAAPVKAPAAAPAGKMNTIAESIRLAKLAKQNGGVLPTPPKIEEPPPPPPAPIVVAPVKPAPVVPPLKPATSKLPMPPAGHGSAFVKKPSPRAVKVEEPPPAPVVEVAAAPAAPKVDPYITYRTMHKLNVPADAMKRKMKADGVSDADITRFLNECEGRVEPPKKVEAPAPVAVPPPAPTPVAAPAAESEAVEDKYSKYKIMQRMNLPEGAIRQKMSRDGISGAEIDSFLASVGVVSETPAPTPSMPKAESPKKEPVVVAEVPKPAPNASPTPAPAPTPASAADEAPAAEDKFHKYKIMQRMNLPEGAIRQKMSRDGISGAEIDSFLASSAGTSSETPTSPSPAPAAEPPQSAPEKVVESPRVPVVTSAKATVPVVESKLVIETAPVAFKSAFPADEPGVVTAQLSPEILENNLTLNSPGLTKQQKLELLEVRMQMDNISLADMLQHLKASESFQAEISKLQLPDINALAHPKTNPQPAPQPRSQSTSPPVSDPTSPRSEPEEGIYTPRVELSARLGLEQSYRGRTDTKVQDENAFQAVLRAVPTAVQFRAGRGQSHGSGQGSERASGEDDTLGALSRRPGGFKKLTKLVSDIL